MNNNNPLPRRMVQNKIKHPMSGHFYSTMSYTNHRGNIIKKFVYLNQNGIQVRDKGKYIYVNKETGEPISGNGKRYEVNNETKELKKNSNGGFILENNYNNSLQKIENLSIKPKKLEKAPPSMMIAKSKTYNVGFKGNMIPKSLVFVEQKSNNQSGLGSMFTAGPGKQINEVPTVYATNKVSIKKFTPGFKIQ